MGKRGEAMGDPRRDTGQWITATAVHGTAIPLAFRSHVVLDPLITLFFGLY